MPRSGSPIPALGSITRRSGTMHPTTRGSPICHDGTERPILRPHDATAQKPCDSGKKKRHMLTNLLLINQALRILVLSETHPGRVHDKRIADTTPDPLPTGSQLLQDAGFQAFTLGGVDILQPPKKPRGHELMRAQKVRNRKLARRRVRIEPVNSRVKRCRMLNETIRMWKAGIRDMVMEIGCALHNFRVRLTPSWTPMV
jgi:DDE superfamily endonuclease